jgi:nucleotide-binding universal stress UspA family protein
VVGDHAENAIVERSRCADLVVLSSNRRTGSSRAFFGHRIDHVLSEVECPVVVVSAN